MNIKKRLRFLAMTFLFFVAPFCKAATSPFGLGSTTDASKLAAGALALGALGGGLWLYNKAKGTGTGAADKTKSASSALSALSMRLRPEDLPMQVQQAATQKATQAIQTAAVPTMQPEESKKKELEHENKELRNQVKTLQKEKSDLEFQNSTLKFTQDTFKTVIKDLKEDKSRLESSSQQTQSAQSAQDQAIIAAARQERDRVKDQLAGKERENLVLKAKLEKAGELAKQLQQKMRSTDKPELQKDVGEIKEDEADDKPKSYQQRSSQREEAESRRTDYGYGQTEQSPSGSSDRRKYGSSGADDQPFGVASQSEDTGYQGATDAPQGMQGGGELSGDDYQQLKENNSQLYADNAQLKAENEKMNTVTKANEKLRAEVQHLKTSYSKLEKLHGTLQRKHVALRSTIKDMGNQMAQTPLDDDELRLLKKLQQSNPYQENPAKVEKPSRSKPRAKPRASRPQAT